MAQYGLRTYVSFALIILFLAFNFSFILVELWFRFKMEEQQSEVLSLDQKMDLMLSKFDALERRVSPVEKSVTDLNTQMAVLEESVSKVVGDAKQVVDEGLAAFEEGRVKEEDVSLTH